MEKEEVADSGVTITGLTEFLEGVDQLPDEMTAALKTLAGATAYKAQRIAKQLLRSHQKTDRHALADKIEVREDLKNKQYQVVSEAPDDQPKNVPIWNEYGTWTMEARPYMRPAEDAVADAYKEDMADLAFRTAQRLIGTGS